MSSVAKVVLLSHALLRSVDAHLGGHLFLQASPPAPAKEVDATDPYNHYCCISNSKEVKEEIKLKVERGAVPTFIQGDLIKMSGGQFEMGQRRFGHQFDAFGKMHKFRFSGDGTVGFSARMLMSKFYNDSIAKGDIVPGLVMGATEPPFHGPQFMEAFMNLPDNTLINAWAVGNDTFLTTTDFARYNEIDRQTLGPRGNYKFDDKWANMLAKVVPTMSCSHVQYIGGGGSVKAGRNTINYMGVTSPGLDGIGMDLTVYRQRWGSNVREPIAKTIRLPTIPLLHSFGVTENYAVFLYHPLGMDIMSTMKHPGPAATSALKWEGEKPSKILVVDISKANKDGALSEDELPEVQVIEVPSFFSVHNVNTYEDGDGKLVTQAACYDKGDFFDPSSGIGFLGTESDPAKRVNRPFPKYCHIEIDLEKNSAKVTSRPSGRRPDGVMWGMEMPRYNDEWQGRKSCFFYGIGMPGDKEEMKASNFTQSIVKTNVCDSDKAGNAVAYTKLGHYAWEAVFVPNGGPAEDDGVVMVLILDGSRITSYLAILDARDMSEVAILYLPEGFTVPNQLHGRFFSYKDFPLPSSKHESEIETLV